MLSFYLFWYKVKQVNFNLFIYQYLGNRKGTRIREGKNILVSGNDISVVVLKNNIVHNYTIMYTIVWDTTL